MILYINHLRVPRRWVSSRPCRWPPSGSVVAPRALAVGMLRTKKKRENGPPSGDAKPNVVGKDLDIAFSPLFVLGNMKNEGKGWIGTAYQHWYYIYTMVL